jgi:hypothetical protein
MQIKTRSGFLLTLCRVLEKWRFAVKKCIPETEAVTLKSNDEAMAPVEATSSVHWKKTDCLID